MPTYRFAPRRNYDVAQLRALDDVHAQQAIQAAEAYSGDSFADVPALVAGLQKAMDQAEIDLDHYEILADGEAAFEMWVVATDNGVVFPLGSVEATAVHCAQSHFWSVDDEDAAAVALAAALDEIVPF